MELYGLMAVLNEAEYVEAALASVYPVCQRIIVAEGAQQWAWSDATKEGLSTDGTTELVRNFPDPGGKLLYLPLGRRQYLTEIREVLLQQVPDTGLVLVVD